MPAKRGTTNPARIQADDFVLFGATATWPSAWSCRPSALALDGLLPRQWRLVGDGRGDVARELPPSRPRRAHHVRPASGDGGPRTRSPSGCSSPAASFTSDSPGSLLDTLAKGRESLGSDPQLVGCRDSPVAFGETTKALAITGWPRMPGWCTEAVRHVAAVLPRPGPGGPFRPRRAAGLPDRRLPRQGATQDLHVLRFANGLFAAMWNASTSSLSRSTCQEARHHRPLGRLRRDRRRLDMLVTHLFQVAAEVADGTAGQASAPSTCRPPGRR